MRVVLKRPAYKQTHEPVAATGYVALRDFLSEWCPFIIQLVARCRRGNAQVAIGS